MIQNERIKSLNDKPIKEGDYVLYWMQASQRSEFNHALEYSIFRANELKKPVVVFLGITNQYPEATARHCRFMLEGLQEVLESLCKRGIRFVVQSVSPEIGVINAARRACLVVVDAGYLKIHRAWRGYAATHLSCPLFRVETDVVIPVETASPKEEYSAATFRPKIHEKLYYFLVPLRKLHPNFSSLHFAFDSLDISDITKCLSELKIGMEKLPPFPFHGGYSRADKLLDMFLSKKIAHYDTLRNDPSNDALSNMSPYLHFGQISPLHIALKVMNRDNSGNQAYLEELIVRRELAINFTHYNSHYDTWEGLHEWSRKTLQEHKKDSRSHVYNMEQMEQGLTEDICWNAAQKEMTISGKMHGYMRMYWGKKILEWTKDPEEAYQNALILNNKYELDGRDPNGYAGVAWCFGKHDRPWFERPIFGKVRYMNIGGLKRKFNVAAYIKKINDLSVEYGL
ncbi:deoxyribodipyrimidine photo-lyase [Candidatus Sumerlaeota bacterium]|nr:deoxyribodipyrimidine photo-lyase [Candidatus Sumerlaeota bacterium]